VSKAQWVGTNYPSSKQVTTSTTDPYPVPGFKENTGRMVAMSGVLLLTNSTDPRFVRLCGEQLDTLLNKDVSKRLKVFGSLEREGIKGRKPLMFGSYKLHFSRAVDQGIQSGRSSKANDAPCLLDKKSATVCRGWPSFPSRGPKLSESFINTFMRV